MVNFTDKAREKIISFMQANPKEGQVLRMGISGRAGREFEYFFSLDEVKNRRPEDVELDLGTFKTLVDSDSSKKMDGATVDWVETPVAAGFKVENPNGPLDMLTKNPTAKKILDLLDAEINPGVAMHGGVVELIDVQGETAFVKLGGGCHGCGQADVTLKQGIETRIRQVVPEIKEVIDTTDHAGGRNPYYSPGHGH